jgi:opacity protein-like surface antigen
MPPAWILDILAAAMLVVAALSVTRLTATWLAALAVPGRAVSGRSWPRSADGVDCDAAHVLMGIAMAGMLVPSVRTLPYGAWELVFGLATAWFGWRVARDVRANGVRALSGPHFTPHLVHSAAMVYMYAAITGGGGAAMSGMGMSGAGARALEYPTLGLVFGLVLAGYSVWDLDQLSVQRRAVAAVPGGTTVPVGAGAAVSVATGSVVARGLLTSPAVTTGCRIAMGVTMAFMLFVMI